MRKIDSSGHNNNRFEDYDAQTNPTGTFMSAKWANDVQDELIGVQEDAGFPEAPGADHQVLKAVKALSVHNAIRYSKPVGALFYLPSYIAPKAFDQAAALAGDKSAQEVYFPAICLDALENPTLDISDSDWPDLVPYLRGVKLTFHAGLTAEQTQFNVTAWETTTSFSTLTLGSGAGEQALIDLLDVDDLVSSSDRYVELPSAIGDIPAGMYQINNIDTVARDIDIQFTAPANSGSVTAIAEFPQHRIPGSTTQARLYRMEAKTLLSPDVSTNDVMTGIVRTDIARTDPGDMGTLGAHLFMWAGRYTP